MKQCSKDKPQALKRKGLQAHCGATEVVPFPVQKFRLEDSIRR
jgi:hypothetical protein